MQITVKESKKLKEGENKYGPWALYKIEATDGKIYTTLTEGADKLTPGAIFEPAAVEIDENNEGAFKFKKFIMVTAPAPKPNGKPDMSKDDWAEKDRLERWSRECNTCFMGIMEVAAANIKQGTVNFTCTQFGEVYDAALDWALKHFNGTPKTAAPTREELKKAIEKTEKQTTADDDFEALESGSEFKNAAEFAARVKKDLGIYPSGICEKLGVKDVKEIADYQAAYELLKENADTEGK